MAFALQKTGISLFNAHGSNLSFQPMPLRNAAYPVAFSCRLQLAAQGVVLLAQLGALAFVCHGADERGGDL